MMHRLTISGVHVKLPRRQSGTGAEKERAPAKDRGGDFRTEAFEGAVPCRLEAVAVCGYEATQSLPDWT